MTIGRDQAKENHAGRSGLVGQHDSMLVRCHAARVTDASRVGRALGDHGGGHPHGECGGRRDGQVVVKAVKLSVQTELLLELLDSRGAEMVNKLASGKIEGRLFGAPDHFRVLGVSDS